MTFEFAEAYAEKNGLYERSGGLPQHFAALQFLVPASVSKGIDWRGDERFRSELIFDHARIFFKSPSATTKAWRVGYSPYPAAMNADAFREVAGLLGLGLSIGEEYHRTYEVMSTIPVMFFRPE